MEEGNQEGFSVRVDEPMERESEPTPAQEDEVQIDSLEEIPVQEGFQHSEEHVQCDETEEEKDSIFQGIRPTWEPDESSMACRRCDLPFTILRRRHHCRFCGKLFCDKCSTVRASYPVWFGYDSPQRVCEGCIPYLFNHRQQQKPDQVSAGSNSPILERKGSKEITFGRSPSSPSIDRHGFHTSGGNEGISLPLRFLHPFCTFAFWVCGMYEGGNFDRTLLSAAASIQVPFTADPIKSVERSEVTVPILWPYTEGTVGPPPDLLATLPESEKQTIPVLIFTPHTGSAPLPVLVWYHGGGFCLGSADNMVYQNICRALANRVGCIVVSVEYRLAPEFKFPTQVEDAWAALHWVYENIEQYGGDKERIAVGGDSAGGSISAVLSILCRERGFPILLRHQLLVYPCITSPLTDDIPSHMKYLDGPVLSRKLCQWFMDQVFDDVDKCLSHPLASPLLLESHHSLPPATIINALHDPLCDHGRLYVEKLWNDGVPATRSVYRKSLHGFFGSGVGESTEALVEAATALRTAFDCPNASRLADS